MQFARLKTALHLPASAFCRERRVAALALVRRDPFSSSPAHPFFGAFYGTMGEPVRVGGGCTSNCALQFAGRGGL